MKKIICSLLIVLGVISLTGCSKDIDLSKKNRIVCTKTEEKTIETTATTLTLSYDANEKIREFRIEEDVQYKSTTSKEAIELASKTMKLLSKTLGIYFDSRIDDNSMHYAFAGNIDSLKLLMKQLDSNYSEDKINGDTKSEALQGLQKEGYTCEDIKVK